MLKRFLAVAALAAILVPATSQAVEKGKCGIGYYDANAPIGIRYVFSEKAAFDFGLGFGTSKDVDYTSTTFAEKTFVGYNVELGVPITLVGTDNATFAFRPGLLWQSIPYQYDNGTTVSNERASDMTFKLHLTAEWFPTERLSLGVGHGIDIQSSKYVDFHDFIDYEPESSTSIDTAALSITQIGFRWYFN